MTLRNGAAPAGKHRREDNNEARMTDEITPRRFDAAIGRPEKLWGAPAIAAALGVSVATVYRMARQPGYPVTKRGGRYFARRIELERWLSAEKAA